MDRTSALIPALLLVAALAPAAMAAPPPNDAPTSAGAFEVYTAVNGIPTERTATAELAEATPDPGVIPCLGSGSFLRTVWYRIPATQTPRELTIEASGRTLDVVDLAAFVQPGPGQTVTKLPNGDSAGDATSGMTLRVDAFRDVLVQVGRRGPVGSPDDERVQLSLSETALPVGDLPDGDRADGSAPSIPRGGVTTVGLGGATTSQEDPFVARCPAAASVWRRVRPPSTGRWTFSADGADAGTLSVFTGARPTPESAVGCIDRQGPGPLTLPVPATKKRLLWVRIGTDRPVAGSVAQLRFRHAIAGDRLDGGACLPSVVPPSVGGSLVGSRAVKRAGRSRTMLLRARVTHGPLCGARFSLQGPKGATYARGLAGIVRGTQVISVRRIRKLKRGLYRLKVDALGVGAIRNPVRSTLTFRLR
ncbi:MAG: hypothetical protein E6G41_13670 [Actinobacteria bacterium]|nr:MAG: hypothetical protein E6G41_13670 [Actinomycetota bacterium]